ncbi:MAG: imidazole glycerol phosphate synthase subunit HisF [Desulfobacca sp. 4484_104]|nr:MAG: imidazole glycerol phosphate synthase subunit HisF [Desulfobacca sp. 4484_104]RLA90224.1 MAG: imidazole glycerol phosphate synthase subunit HisF [Deltaproteobacteria bacterium]
MNYIRVIPCLDIKDGRVVKGIHFVDLQDAGDPVENARLYEQEGADELAFLDITATVEGRQTTMELVKEVAAAISIPLTVGGGVKSCADIENLLKAGVAKVGINTAAIQNPDLIKEAAQAVGSPRLVVAIDARRNGAMPSGYELVIHGGRTLTGQDAIAWAARCRELGAGELLPTSMDTDGVKNGYDLELTRKVKEASQLPVTASGGAGSVEHLYEAVVWGKADAVLAASIFHFREISIRAAKEYLHSKGLPVRL